MKLETCVGLHLTYFTTNDWNIQVITGHQEDRERPKSGRPNTKYLQGPPKPKESIKKSFNIKFND